MREDQSTEWSRSFEGYPISELGLPFRAMNCLRQARIRTVEKLLTKTPDELLNLRNFGQGSLESVVACLDQFGLALPSEGRPPTPAPIGFLDFPATASSSSGNEETFELPDPWLKLSRHSETIEHLTELTAWAEECHPAGSLGELFAYLGSLTQPPEDPGFPLASWDHLRELGLAEVSEDKISHYSWRQAVDDVLAPLIRDETDSLIVEHRLAVIGKAESQTFDEIGSTLDLSRERVRQREARILKDLGQAAAGRGIASMAHRIVNAVGAMLPLDHLSVLGLKTDCLPDRLMIGLAGRTTSSGLKSRSKYRVAEYLGTLWIHDQDTNPETVVGDAFSRFGPDGLLTEDELLSAVVEVLSDGRHSVDPLPSREPTAKQLITAYPGIKWIDGKALRWNGTYADKSVRVLALHGRPMDRNELAEAVKPEEPRRGVINQFQADERVRRVGPKSYGLASWDFEQYSDIVSHMRETIEGSKKNSMLLLDLKTDLYERFGISPTSINMHATSHPLFVLEGQKIRLRRADEPLDLPPLVDNGRTLLFREGPFSGKWALKLQANNDHLRGSGTPLPSNFGWDLGCRPGQTGELSWGETKLYWGWTQQTPSIGSLRSTLEEHGINKGDPFCIVSLGKQKFAIVTEVPAVQSKAAGSANYDEHGNVIGVAR